MEYILWKIRNEFVTVLCIIFSMLSLIVYYMIDWPPYLEQDIKIYKPIQFKTLLDDKPISFNSTWISDDEILTRDDDGNIILHDVNKLTKSIIAFNSMQHIKNCHTYELSADKKYLLIAYDTADETFDYLSTSHYDVINIKTGKQVTLRDTEHKPRSIMVAKWSPTASMLAIVDNYNIYLILTAAKPNHVKQITFGGRADLYYGIPDWVYKEEILNSNSAMWFSNQGTKLAYTSLNETLVPSMHLARYGIPDTMYDQYSSIHSYHYPKANDPNPMVELFVQYIDINNVPTPIAIKPTIKYDSEIILYDVAWSDDEHLFVMWMNRIQNKSHLVHYHISNNTAEVKEAMEFNQENGWINFRKSFFISQEHLVALIYPVEQENEDSYGHACIINTKGELLPITNGYYEVTKLIKWDFESNYLYYLANIEHSSETQHVYRVLIGSEKQQAEPECLTCDTGCTFNSAELSEKNTYYAHICKGPQIPYVNIMKLDGSHTTAWKSSEKLYNNLVNVALPRVMFLTVPLVDDYEARVKLLIPPTVDVSSDKKYPLLIYSNGGPVLNTVLDEFQIDLNTYLSVNHNIIIAKVDGRGTGRRGSRNLFANYKKLGTGEIDDQITVAKFLQSNLTYVDKNRTGIWGWGLGGYLAGMTLAKDDEKIFKCGLSVAPITDWMYYDSVYTERFMDTYAENFEAYRNASLIENAEGLRYKKFMIIHGMFDKNVIFQHSAMLSKELQHKSIAFKQQFYPDEMHEFSNVKPHLYHTIITFLSSCK